MCKLLGFHTDRQLCFARYFFHNPTAESDTEEESADEGDANEHVKEEPVDEDVPLFIPPDSPPLNLDHGKPVDLDSLPHSDWIKLEPEEASLPSEPRDNDTVPADGEYETDREEPADEDEGWTDLFEAWREPDDSQSTLKSEEVHPYPFIYDSGANDHLLAINLDG